MKIKWSGIGMVDGRGKINGSVASKNRSGAYVRVKVTPVNRRTVAQQTVRSLFAGLSRSWSGLTDTERHTWNGAVQYFSTTDIFGDIRHPSGFNLFQKLNLNLSNVGLAPLATAPRKSLSTAVVNVNADYSLVTGEFTVNANLSNPSPLSQAVILVIEATPALANGITFVENQYRKIGQLSAVALGGSATPVPITTINDMWKAHFGDVPEGSTNFYFRVKVVLVSSGEASKYYDTKAFILSD